MIEMERSSGNLFEDMGVPDAENMKLRAELIVEIRRTMEEKGWNQTEAAEHLGVSRTRLNDILRGTSGEGNHRPLGDDAGGGRPSSSSNGG